MDDDLAAAFLRPACDLRHRGRLVDQVDRLVRHAAIRHIARRQLHRSGKRVIRDRHMVIILIPLAQAAQNQQRFIAVRLPHVDALEAPGQCRVLLDILAVFLVRRRADDAHLAAGQRRLEDVRRIHAALAGAARADQRVHLVDKQDDVAHLLHAGQHLLDALLKLAAVLAARNHLRHVQCADLGVSEHRRHIAPGNPRGQPLRQRGFAHARLADEQRIVLRLLAQHADHGVYLGPSADERLQFAVGSCAREVARVLIKQLLLGHALLPLPLLRLLRGCGLLAGNRRIRRRNASGRQRPLDLARRVDQRRAHALDRLAEILQDVESAAAVLIKQLVPDVRDAGQRLLLRVGIAERAQQHALRMRREPRDAGEARFAPPVAAEHLPLDLLHGEVAHDALRQFVAALAQAHDDVPRAHPLLTHGGGANLRLYKRLHGALCESLGYIHCDSSLLSGPSGTTLGQREDHAAQRARAKRILHRQRQRHSLWRKRGEHQARLLRGDDLFHLQMLDDFGGVRAADGRADALIQRLQQLLAAGRRQADDADIAAAAAPRLDHIAVIRRKARGQHIVDLRRRALKVLRQFVSSQFYFMRLIFHERLDEVLNGVAEQSHLESLSLSCLISLTFFDLLYYTRFHFRLQDQIYLASGLFISYNRLIGFA